MTRAPKPIYQQLAPSATRTSSYASPALEAKSEPGILVILNVTAASGTGGLSLRINAREPDYAAGTTAPWTVPLNNAPTPVTTTGSYSYTLYPWSAAGASSTSFYLPRTFSIHVEHADSSSYTYSLGYQLLT